MKGLAQRSGRGRTTGTPCPSRVATAASRCGAVLVATAAFAALALRSPPVAAQASGVHDTTAHTEGSPTTLPPQPRPPLCLGRYAPMMTAIRKDALALERHVRWTFCVRSTATYQCLSYGSDGEVRRVRHTVRSHGTAFAFRREGSRTLLLTNEHVSDWPFVSGDDDVEGVGPGCRRVSSTLSVVDNEDDSYSKDDIPLSRVLSDAELDIAILRAPFRVSRIPFDVGRSAGLRTGAAVHVRGYPLGAFQAVTLGKIINPRHPDREQGWNHLDFVVDAPLSEGSSGSPVLAANCRTGRFELIGVFHAAYKGGQSLNVVVGVDQLVDLMRTLRPRPSAVSELVPTPQDRAALVARLRAGGEPLLPFGGALARVDLVGAKLRFVLYSKRFPLHDRPLASVIDTPSDGGGKPTWFGVSSALRAVEAQRPATQRIVHRVWRLLRLRARDVTRYRRLSRRAGKSRGAHLARERLARSMEAREGDERGATAALVAALRRRTRRPAPTPTRAPRR